ncbi:hypothetical protein ACLOJK_037621 [Asimina triloba]
MDSTSSSVQDEIEPLTGHPFFTWVLSPTNVSGGFQMRVPQKFVKFLPLAEVPMILHCRDKRWEMKYYGNRQFSVFDYNWKYFAVDNNLKVGDALIFELIDDKKVEFKVQILDGKIPSVAIPCNEGGSSASPIIID